MREKNKPYPEQFRLQVVELAMGFGCHESSIVHWVGKYAGSVDARLPPSRTKPVKPPQTWFAVNLQPQTN